MATILGVPIFLVYYLPLVMMVLSRRELVLAVNVVLHVLSLFPLLNLTQVKRTTVDSRYLDLVISNNRLSRRENPIFV